ncbi:MAG: type I restriction enzyme HsdR N-terminal domain-containing protein [Bacteroidales bacterium]|nr:type I restriction enzyme HsdR N-terminal domain-containing protein [Bacteroidales bacterium]
MDILSLPSFEPKIKDVDGQRLIFDQIRRRYVALTPEEWVRQHFVHFLTDQLGYPAGLLANEVQISLNGTKKRCDTVLYNRQRSPYMIIEYKRPNTVISDKVFNQILRYNLTMHVRYLIVSNGITHYCCKVNYEENCYDFLEKIPHFNELL